MGYAKHQDCELLLHKGLFPLKPHSAPQHINGLMA